MNYRPYATAKIATFTERTILLNDGLIVKDVQVETQSAREMLNQLRIAN
jgi:hypothetical protein